MILQAVSAVTATDDYNVPLFLRGEPSRDVSVFEQKNTMAGNEIHYLQKTWTQEKLKVCQTEVEG